jgi:hypothetical protein
MPNGNVQVGPIKVGWEFVFRMLVTGSMLTAMLWVLSAQISELKTTMGTVQANQQEMREDVVGLKTSLRYIEGKVDRNANSRMRRIPSGTNPYVGEGVDLNR